MPTPGTAAIDVVDVVDDSGDHVVLARPARRIVSLSPHLTEQLYAIGAGERIVGSTDFADYPAAARLLPRVARAHSVDLERVAAARPDLIVTWGSGYPATTLAALRRLGVPVYVDEPASLDGIAVGMQRLAQLAGGDARQAGAALRARLAALRARYSGRAPVRVFYQIWSQPLMTIGGHHVLTEAISLCGGRNVFAELDALAPQVSAEAVVAADPDLLLTAAAGGTDDGALDPWLRFPGLRAVRNGQRATLDADRINRWTPRMAEEIGVLCERIDAARRADRR